MLCNFRQQEFALCWGWLHMNRNTHVLIISEPQQGRAGGVLLDFEVAEKLHQCADRCVQKHTRGPYRFTFVQLGMRPFITCTRWTEKQRATDVPIWQWFIQNFVFPHLPQMSFIFINLHIQLEMLNLCVYIYIQSKFTVHLIQKNVNPCISWESNTWPCLC